MRKKIIHKMVPYFDHECDDPIITSGIDCCTSDWDKVTCTKCLKRKPKQTKVKQKKMSKNIQKFTFSSEMIQAMLDGLEVVIPISDDAEYHFEIDKDDLISPEDDVQ